MQDTLPMVTRKENAARLQAGTGNFGTGLPEAGRQEDLLRNLPGVQTVMSRIRDLAEVDVPILIEGEPGTGVEFVAKEIHALSQRHLRPFVTVSCAAMAESTVMGQLWGYERGTFGDAREDRPGLFESIDGGTVFFEEIHDVSYSVQIQLARMLKTREIARVNQSRSRRVNVRLVCATHFNLVREAAEGRFCPDLLYRIRVGQIRVPPLRERMVDLPLLIAFYLSESRRRPDQPPPSLGDEAMRILLAYPWPGNMTELQSAIESAALHCGGPAITAADLPLEIRDPGTASSLAAGPGQAEKGRFLAAMEAAKGNRTQAAKLLGISRATLYRRLKGLDQGV